ncbi:MAG: hypothetical protein ACRDRL_16615 [Sciscionella sp.]
MTAPNTPSASSSDGAGTRIGGSQPPGGSSGAAGSGSGDGAFTTSGPAFKVDFGEANQALAHLEEAYNSYDRAWQAGQYMPRVNGPGHEQPSQHFAGGVGKLGADELAKIRNQRDAAGAAYRTLKAQLDSQQRTEDANAAALRKSQG